MFSKYTHISFPFPNATVYHNMNPLMSSKRRRNASSKGNMRRWQSGRNCNTRSPILVSLQSNRLGSPTARLDQGPHSPFTTPSLKWELVAPATTMGSHVGPVVAQTDIRKVGTLAADIILITQIAEAKAVGAIIMGPILHKAVGPLMLGVGCLEQVVLVEEPQVVVGMDLELRIIPRVVRMVAQLVGEDQIWVVIATSSTTGSSGAEFRFSMGIRSEVNFFSCHYGVGVEFIS